MAAYSFLSDLQQPARPFAGGNGASPETSAYWEKSGRPQMENAPGPQFPALENGPQQLTGSRMFTPLEHGAPQQGGGGGGPPPHPQQQQSAPMTPMQQLQRDNAYLRSQLNALVNHLQQQKQQQAHAAAQSPSGSGTGNKRTTELLITVMVVLFAGVLITMFATLRKVSAATRTGGM